MFLSVCLSPCFPSFLPTTAAGSFLHLYHLLVDTATAVEEVAKFHVLVPTGHLVDAQVVWPHKQTGLNSVEGNLEPLGGRPRYYVLYEERENEKMNSYNTHTVL